MYYENYWCCGPKPCTVPKKRRQIIPTKLKKDTNMEISFVKMHGNGNDFILIDEMEGTIIPDEMKGDFAELYCDRWFGIGGDGVIFVSPSEAADVKMSLFQPDRSEAEMCGNGIRCLAIYAQSAGLVKDTCTVETMAGVLDVVFTEQGVAVTMTDPVFDRGGLPATGDADAEYCEEINGLMVYAANTGVPHAVVFVDDVAAVDLMKDAHPIRFHESFLQGANVNFVQVTGENELTIRTFERGVEEETLSCGTGATASAAIAYRLKKVGSDVLVQTAGGPLSITVGEKTVMNGPATVVFSGVISF